MTPVQSVPDDFAAPVSEIRKRFLQRLTVDSEHRDRRRADYNQAIFARAERGGYAIFTGTDLDMVLRCFDDAVRDAVKATQDSRWMQRHHPRSTDPETT
jgi:hypothetical protein